jgi:hypothetical protein
MGTPSAVGITPGNGDEKIATYEITEGGDEVQLQRQVLNDADGVELKGQRARAASVPTTASPEDLSALTATDPATGFVAIPTSGETALVTPVRAIVITLAGNLGVKLADATNNNSKLIPVTAGQMLPLRVVQLTAANTAGVLGLA